MESFFDSRKTKRSAIKSTNERFSFTSQRKIWPSLRWNPALQQGYDTRKGIKVYRFFTLPLCGSW